METSTIEAGEWVSTLSAAGVQRQLSMLPGVHHADVDCVAGSATVHCDEATTTLDAIRQGVVDCGCHGRSELAPAHACAPTDHRTASAAHAAHAGHARHADHSMPGGAHGASGTSSPDQQAAMLHDIGHPTGMSMQGMADDMRNRFLVVLVFAVPVFPYSPMSEMAGNLPTPFGMDRKRFLFFAATAAIAYLVSLRRLRRVLPTVAKPGTRLLLRLFHAARRVAGPGAAQQAGTHLPQAAAAARPAFA